MSKAIDHLGQKKIYLGLGVLLVGYLGYRLVQWILNSADSSTKKATTIGKKKLPTENQQPGDPSSLPVSSATTTATKTTTVFAPATSPVKVEPHEQAKPSKILANYILSFNSSHPLYNYKDNYLPIKNKCIEASIPNLIFDDEKSLIYVCGSARAIPQLKIEEGLSSSELYASFFGIRSLCHLTLKKRLLYLPPKHVEFLQKAIPRNEQELRNIISQIPLNVFSVKHATVVDRKYIHWINQLRLHFHTYYDMETLKRLLKESGWEENNLIGMGYTIEAPYKLKYYSDYTLCEYTPASDLFTNLLSHQEQSEFDSRSCGF
ncbi:MAG TPA: hypothetical protein VHK67_07330, partial [Rhabdochlamydiaceae bacterium]|nr:hypothetical protein [Rhabdochlamydiaceae bacterium]